MNPAQPPNRSVPPEQDDLVDALVQASFVTMAVLNRIGADQDLSLTQLRVLAILQDRRLRMNELAEYLGLDRSTMTGLVSRAEKRGLLQRAPNETDGRAVDVFLTAAGAELAANLHHQVAQALSPVTDVLPPGDQRKLQSLLSRMIDRQ